MQGKEPLGLLGQLVFVSHILPSSQGESGFLNSIFTNRRRHSLLWPGRKKPTLPHTKIVLQSFNSLTRVKRLHLPMQLPLHPHLQRLGQETHSQESFTIPPSLPTMRVQQPKLFLLHRCHPAGHQPWPPWLAPTWPCTLHPTRFLWQLRPAFETGGTPLMPARLELGLKHIPAVFKGKKCCCSLMLATFTS